MHLALVHVQRKKEAISCTRFYVQDQQWIGNIFNSYPYDLISLHWFLRQYLCLYKTSCRGEMVTSPRRSVTDTSGLTSAGCHLTRLASDLGQARQKYVCTVHLSAAYDTCPHQWRISVAQWGKNHIGKKIVSSMSVCDVTCLVSLVTNNLKHKSLWEWRIVVLT